MANKNKKLNNKEQLRIKELEGYISSAEFQLEKTTNDQDATVLRVNINTFKEEIQALIDGKIGIAEDEEE